MIARSPNALRETFLVLEQGAKKLNLTINQSKTKYMMCPKQNNNDLNTYFTIGSYKFDSVNSFTYLRRTEINAQKDLGP